MAKQRNEHLDSGRTRNRRQSWSRDGAHLVECTVVEGLQGGVGLSLSATARSDRVERGALTLPKAFESCIDEKRSSRTGMIFSTGMYEGTERERNRRT